MATGLGGEVAVESTEDSVPVVLRVKRKRTEDPAESLVVKKLRRLDSSLNESDDLYSVFHLVETTPTHNITQTQVLLQESQGSTSVTIKDHIKSCKPTDHSLLVKKNPFSSLTISDRQEDRREKKKVSSQSHRFKVVAKHRSLNDPETQDETKSGPTASNGETSSAKELMSELVHLYDVVVEDSETDSKAANGRPSDDDKKTDLAVGGMEVAVSGAAKPREGAITCNSTEMIREKQHCASDANVDLSSPQALFPSMLHAEKLGMSPEGLESDYVYDLYYTRGHGTTGYGYDWESLCIYDSRYGIELFNYDLLHPTSFNDYDDDDDSNAEDNWRNDYPDEEDLFHSDSEEEGQHSRAAYRYHDSYDDYIFDETHDDPYQQNTSYWHAGIDNPDHDS